MASSRKLKDVECEKNSGHKGFILLQELTLSDIPESHRSQRNLDLVRRQELLAARIEVKIPGPGAESCLDSNGRSYMSGLDDNMIKMLNYESGCKVDLEVRDNEKYGIGCINVDNNHTDKLFYGSGCIIAMDKRKTDEVALVVRTVGHLWHKLGEKIITSVFLRIPDTGEVLESSSVVVEEVEFVDDIAILSVIFDFSNIKYVLPKLQDAIQANFDSLHQSVLRKYQTVPLSLYCFLKYEIRCIKSLKFAHDKVDVLEIAIEAAPHYLIDVNLFISALVSHDYNLLNLMRKIANGSVIKTRTECSTEPAVKQFSAEQTKLLNSIKTALCKPLEENIIRELESYLKPLLRFGISLQLKCSTVIVMSVDSPVFPAGDGIATGNNREMMGFHMKAQNKDGKLNSMHDFETDSKEQGTTLTDVPLGTNKEEQEQGTTLTDVPLGTNKEEQEQGTTITDIPLGTNKKEAEDEPSSRMQERETGGKEQVGATQLASEIKDGQDVTLVALIFYPHDLQQPYVKFGMVKRLEPAGVVLDANKKKKYRYREDNCNPNVYGEVFYTNRSCPGSSGGLVCLIGGELEDISFATHSAGSNINGIGIMFKLPNNQE